jgi:CubicO group peptidase (beta-lactamase class C family)
VALTDPFTASLVALPAQPAGVPWPTAAWPRGEVPDGVALAPLLDELFHQGDPLGQTYACIVVHGGRLVAERYAGEIPHMDRDAEPVSASTQLLSWSMAKSMLHAVVGMLVAEGALDTAAAANVPAWQESGDPRREITLEHLLCMRDGLDFAEDYVDAGRSDVIEMLFGSGADDVAAFAVDRGLAARPGERFNYSSGTSNIVSSIVAGAIGAGAPYERFVAERLFGAIGMTTARATFDAAGTWIASSYVHCSAQDFARFGFLYLRDGMWDGARVLPESWVDHARRIRSEDTTDGVYYGAHWWAVGDEFGSFRASGYEGQSILLVPALDLMVVRLGKTDASHYPDLAAWRRRVTAAFAAAPVG